jgi:CheY-like chemotaxis protein
MSPNPQAPFRLAQAQYKQGLTATWRKNRHVICGIPRMSAACTTENVLIAASEVDERLAECLASCRATFVRTFDEAQRALREQLFRLIVIDLNFDNIRMFELLQHVRSLARFNDVPVLCIRGANGGAGISAALDRVVRMLGGRAFLDLRGNDRALSGTFQRLCNIVGAEVGVELAPPRSRLCMLIIDRDVDAAHQLGELLEQLGHEVDFAYEAGAGIDAAQRLRPDAVFIDIASRSACGYRLARRLRRESDSGALLLIALAPAPNEEDRRRMRDAGFDKHLAKPANRQSVSSLLESCRAHMAR